MVIMNLHSHEHHDHQQLKQDTLFLLPHGDWRLETNPADESELREQTDPNGYA